LATKEIYLTGKIKWAKGLAEMDEKFKSYSCAFYPTEKSLIDYKQLDLKTKFRMDDDGESFSLRRPDSKIFNDEVKKFGPPEVFMEINGVKTVVDPLKLGNGSDVTVKIAVYDTGYGKGSRLEAIRVDNYIEFIPMEKAEGNNNFNPPFDN
jgi:hypothetical protein